MEKKDHRPLTLKEQAYNILKERIVQGDYKPNEQLKEEQLAKSLNISRTPLREVLKQLSGEGLLINIPNRGVFVRDVTIKDIDEIFDMRVMMESYAVERLITLLDNEKAQELLVIKEKLIASSSDKALYSVIDTQLHRTIIRLSENEMLQDINKKVETLFHPLRSISLKSQGRMADSVLEHVRIIDAIVERDAAKAKIMVGLHLSFARDEAKRQIIRKQNFIC